MRTPNFAFALIVFSLLPSYLFATPPGRPVSPLKEQTLDVTMILSAIAHKEGKLRGVELVWLPEEIREYCLQASVHECRQKEIEVRRAKRANVGARGSSDLPDRAMSSWIAMEDAPQFESLRLLDELSQDSFIKRKLAQMQQEKKSQLNFSSYSEGKKYSVRVKWTVYPNGQNFRILEIE